MFFQLVLFFLLLALLYFLSQKIQTFIFKNVFIATGNKKLAIGVLVILLLPGTIIHEISHFFVATILRVSTGDLTVIPSIEKDGKVKAGKLILDQTDPFRLSIIGLAPMIVGLVIIYMIGTNLLVGLSNILDTKYLILNIFGFYLLFITSITMFSSKKDLESLIIAGPLILIVIISLYVTGVRIYFEKSLAENLASFLSKNNYYLLITAVLDLLILLITSANLSLWQGILKRKLS